jgi:hypothetical protein
LHFRPKCLKNYRLKFVIGTFKLSGQDGYPVRRQGCLVIRIVAVQHLSLDSGVCFNWLNEASPERDYDFIFSAFRVEPGKLCITFKSK